MNRLSLTGISFKEWVGPKLNWEIKPCSLEDLTLLTGDNAQGKTRFINVLKFIKNLHSRAIQFPNPNLRVEAELSFSDGEDHITYGFEIYFSKQAKAAVFNDKVTKNEQTLLDRKTNTLFDELNHQSIENFFVPPNAPAVVAMDDEKFVTLKKIKAYLHGIIFFDSLRFTAQNLEVTPGQLALRDNGSNLASVITSLEQSHPEQLKLALDEFYDCFPNIIKGTLSIKNMPVPQAGTQLEAPVMVLNEKSVEKPLPQFEWSESYSRTLCLFLLAFLPFPVEQPNSNPSLVVVDDFGVGLDYNTVTQVLSLYQEKCDNTGFLLVSHDNLICAMVPSKQWRVTKRRASAVEVAAPNVDLQQMEEKRQKLLKENFAFYRTHLAKSHLFSVN